MKVNFQFLPFLDLYYKKSTQFALKKGQLDTLIHV